jgi:hypothetical protein
MVSVNVELLLYFVSVLLTFGLFSQFLLYFFRYLLKRCIQSAFRSIIISTKIIFCPKITFYCRVCPLYCPISTLYCRRSELYQPKILRYRPFDNKRHLSQKFSTKSGLIDQQKKSRHNCVQLSHLFFPALFKLIMLKF